MGKIILLTIFLFIFVNTINATSFVEPYPFPLLGCRNYTLPDNVPIEKFKYKIIKNLWNFASKNRSADAELLEDLIVPYLNASNTDTNLNRFAEDLTILTTVFRRRYEFHETSACAIGDFINSMTSCLRNNSPVRLLNSYLHDLYFYMANYFYIDVVSDTDCIRGDFPLLLPNWDCEDNGFVYEIDYILDRILYFPSNLKNVIKRLYNSENHSDKFLAALATFAATPDAILTSKLNQFEYLELVNSYSVGQINPECCRSFINRQQYLVNKYYDGVLNRIERNREFYSAPDACK